MDDPRQSHVERWVVHVGSARGRGAMIVTATIQDSRTMCRRRPSQPRQTPVVQDQLGSLDEGLSIQSPVSSGPRKKRLLVFSRVSSLTPSGA